MKVYAIEYSDYDEFYVAGMWVDPELANQAYEIFREESHKYDLVEYEVETDMPVRVFRYTVDYSLNSRSHKRTKVTSWLMVKSEIPRRWPDGVLELNIEPYFSLKDENGDQVFTGWAEATSEEEAKKLWEDALAKAKAEHRE